MRKLITVIVLMVSIKAAAYDYNKSWQAASTNKTVVEVPTDQSKEFNRNHMFACVENLIQTIFKSLDVPRMNHLSLVTVRSEFGKNQNSFRFSAIDGHSDSYTGRLQAIFWTLSDRNGVLTLNCSYWSDFAEYGFPQRNGYNRMAIMRPSTMQVIHDRTKTVVFDSACRESHDKTERCEYLR